MREFGRGMLPVCSRSTATVLVVQPQGVGQAIGKGDISLEGREGEQAHPGVVHAAARLIEVPILLHGQLAPDRAGGQSRATSPLLNR